jgi:2-polyprenyl-3-methyl-5-hydroxy-6-metoxy-1,4-benzoquinol methylase
VQGRSERWTAPDGRGFDIDVRLGKPLDVRGLKASSIDDVTEYAAFLRSAAARLYGEDRPADLGTCPCCRAEAAAAAEVLRVFDVAYVRCPRCRHGFVRQQPAVQILDEEFTESEEHSSIYTDPATLEVRMAQVVRPKVQWVLDAWSSRFAGSPARAIDVGAGGGHMVAGLREAGMDADGYELSESSRRFARAAFGVELLGDDFLAAAPDPVDVVTYWGLLEYTSDPHAFVDAARRRLTRADGGLLVVEVPRFDSISTAVQGIDGAVVSRHLDPTTHVNCFSDESLATVLLAGGFAPIAAWYFGMDAYELLVQIALRLGGDATLEQLAEPLLALQPALDGALACDDIVLAAVPL